ncbi:hypothetical protein A2U01_0084260, partial [Trifolium medium]|nr:hypothetical protein [Trifolium medium]
WEDVDALRSKFPSFNLEDKVDFYGDGIVMKPKGSNILETNDSANDERHDALANKAAKCGEVQPIRKSNRMHKEHAMWKDYVKN